MLLEFFKKRVGNFPVQYTFIADKVGVILLKFGEPQEVPEDIAYKILGEASDIIRKVEAEKPVKGTSKAPKVKQSKRKKVVEDFTTA
jgi:hypothetical protein